MRPLPPLFPMMLVVLAICVGSGVAFGQCQPTSLAVAPTAIYQGDAYWMYVDCANITVDVQYQFDYGPTQTIISWPSMNIWGDAYIQTNSLTAFGTYTFVGVRNSAVGGAFAPVNASVTVTSAPPHPTTLNISPASLTAGHGSYLMTVGNGANMTLDVDYELNLNYA